MERLAGYLNINSYNPFTEDYTEIKCSTTDQNQAVSTPDNQLESLESKVKPDTPEASPRQSPDSSPRKLSGSQHISASPLAGSPPLPSPGIEIVIQSPSAAEMEELCSTTG